MNTSENATRINQFPTGSAVVTRNLLENKIYIDVDKMQFRAVW